MATYCKAYLLTEFQKFAGWTENSANAAPSEDSTDATAAPRALDEESVLFLHQNYVVTDGAFSDENIIFDAVSPEWIEFCETSLQFAVPPDLLRKQEAADMD
jgi:hypothetical protein